MTQAGLAIGAQQSTYLRGVAMVMTAGAIWSLGGLLVRSMEAAGAWQILFVRSTAVALTVLALLLWRYRGDCLATIRRAGWLAVAAGLMLGVAFCGFIFSLMYTTVANAVFVLSASPSSPPASAGCCSARRSGAAPGSPWRWRCSASA